MVEYFDESYFKDYKKSEVKTTTKKYVLAEDYQKIEAERDALKTNNAKLREALENLVADYERLLGDGVTTESQPWQLKIAKQALEVGNEKD